MSLILDELYGEILSSGNIVKTRLMGWSMHPFLSHGQLVEIRSVNPSEMQIGDVAIYTAGKGLIAHRIIKRIISENTSYFLCKGDDLTGIESVSEDEILGKIVAVHKKSGVISTDGSSARLWNRIIAVVSLWSTKSYFLAHYYRFVRGIYGFLYGKKWIKSFDPSNVI